MSDLKPTTLKAWYYLTELTATSELIKARFLPDFFRSGDPTVLTIVVERPSDLTSAVALLQRFREEPVTELLTAADLVELWSEYDESPTQVFGGKIGVEWSAYSASELFDLALQFEKRRETADAEVVKLRQHMQALEEFVLQLLQRAESKRSLTAKSAAAVDAQIDVLQRVIHRLRAG